MAASQETTGRVVQAAAQVYAVPLADFVAHRTALAQKARAEGDRDAARQIGALRKPSVSAWALNQVARNPDGALEQLRDLGARLRHAQSSLDAAALAALRGDRDEILAAVVRAARELAEHHGQPLTAPVEAEVRDTAIAALADGSAEEVLRSGAMTRALSYSGFGEVDVADAVARTSSGVVLTRIRGGRDDPDVASQPAEATAPGRDLAAAQADLAAAQADLAAADEELTARSARLDQARARGDSAQARVDQLRADLARAQAEAEAAAEAVTVALQAHRAGQAEVTAARERLAELRTGPGKG